MISTNKKITIVIPALNESKTIEKIVKEAKLYANEVIVVNDGSSDDTEAKAEKSGAIILHHEKSQGYGKSVNDGFCEAVNNGASVIVTFDADGEHKTEDIERLVYPIINNEADIVVGERQGLAHFSEKIFSFYAHLFFGIKDPFSGLKAYSSKVYEKIGHFDTLDSLGAQLTVEAIRRGFRSKNIPIEAIQREGTSRVYSSQLKTNCRFFMAMVRVILFAR